MEEIKLSKLREEDAYELDKRLAYCAKMALEEAEKDRDRATNLSEIMDDDVRLIMECFERAKFAYKDCDHVKHVRGRLKCELQKVFLSDDNTRCSLMLPIAGYNLIVHNEFQYEAVRKRARNDMKRPHAKSYEDYPYNAWRRNKPYSVTRKENVPHSKAFEDEKNNLYNLLLSSTWRKEEVESICELCGILDKYDSVMAVQNLAQISLFLRDILLSHLEEHKPMDTLILLYLANHLDESVFRSFALCDEYRYYSMEEAKQEKNRRNLLSLFHCNYVSIDKEDCFGLCECNDPMQMSFFTQVKEEEDPIQMSFFPEHNEEEEPLQLSFDSGYEKKTFIELYNELVDNYYISMSDMKYLLNILFNEETLQEYSELKKRVLAARDIVYECAGKGYDVPKVLFSRKVSLLNL